MALLSETWHCHSPSTSYSWRKAIQEDYHKIFLSFSNLQAPKELVCWSVSLGFAVLKKKTLLALARLHRQMPTSSKKLNKKKVPRNSKTKQNKISGMKLRRVMQEKHQTHKLGTSTLPVPADANREATGTLWMSLLSSSPEGQWWGRLFLLDPRGSTCAALSSTDLTC